jgi:hypothetical protein
VVDLLFALVGPVDMEDLHLLVTLLPLVGNDETGGVVLGIEVKPWRN